MLKNVFANIEAFAYHYFHLEQTALINELLANDKHLRLQEHLYNMSTYSVQLSDGLFTGTNKTLTDKLESINRLLDSASQDEYQYRSLIEDRDRLETVEGQERTVFEWYAIPYWIAHYFIDMGEVVLLWQSYCWWGRTITGMYLFNDAVVCLLHKSILKNA